VDDVASAAECLGAHAACTAERLVELEAPRAGELFRLAGVALRADACLEDFGGTGAGLDDKAAAKLLAKCMAAVSKAGVRIAEGEMAAYGKCTAAALACQLGKPGDAACLTKAGAACGKNFATLAADAAKATVAADKACAALDVAALTAPNGGNLGAVAGRCGASQAAFGPFAEYRACLVESHRCRGAAAVAWTTPRAEELLTAVGQAWPDTAACEGGSE
jgi:hypothetical protein